MYDLVEYSGNYSQASGSLWLYYRDQQALDNNGNIIEFPVYDATNLSFKCTKNVIGRKGNDGQKNNDIWVPLKYLSNFWRILKMSLISRETNLILTWPDDCI